MSLCVFSLARLNDELDDAPRETREVLYRGGVAVLDELQRLSQIY